MTTISKTWRARMAVLAVGTLALAACGGDDDDDAAADAAEDADDQDAAPADDNNDGDNDDDGDDDKQEVDDLGDLPDECVDALGDMLEKLEPMVEDIDWENASLDELASIGDELSSDDFEIDEELEDRCSQFDFAEGADMDAIREVARDRAPGVLGYIDFIENMQEEFADMTIPDISIPDISMPDISIPDISIPDISVPDVTLPADAPQTCEEAMAYIEGVMEQTDSMMDLSLSDMTAFGTASTVLSTECSIEQVSEFYGRPDVSQWMSGT